MAPFGQEGHPTACLLLNFGHGLMVQEVGQPHLLVAHIVAQAQVSWYVQTLGLLGVEAAIVEVVRLPAVVVILICGRDGKEEEEGEGRQAQCQAEGALGQCPPGALLSVCHASTSSAQQFKKVISKVSKVTQ